MCRTLKNILQRKDAGRGKILFVNIADHSYNPKAHADIAYEDAMDTMHIIRRNGDIITGAFPATIHLTNFDHHQSSYE